MTEYRMKPQPYCKYCARWGHTIEDCPSKKPIAKVEEVARVKKPWVKPELRVYKRVDKMSTEEIIGLLKDRGMEAVSTKAVDKLERRRQQQREWAKKKRAKG